MKQLTLAFFIIVQSSLVLAGKMENWEGLDGQLNDGEKNGGITEASLLNHKEGNCCGAENPNVLLSSTNSYVLNSDGTPKNQQRATAKIESPKPKNALEVALKK